MEHPETEPSKYPQPKVVIFTQPDCPPCHVVKEFLSERGIVFEERDVTRDPSAVQDLVQKYKSHSTPTLLVGDEVMIGFDPDRLDQLLEK
jgi:glutaredoxin-like YruB-family protein